MSGLIPPEFMQLLEQTARQAGAIIQAKAPDVVLAAFERLFVGDVIEFDRRALDRVTTLLPTFRKSVRARNWAEFPTSSGRNAFLAAARSFLRSKGNEWIIVGLGTWKAHRSTVREVVAWEGGRASARLPASIDAEAAGHLRDGERAELLHVHNHPAGVWRDIKNYLVGDDPIPSAGDRHNLLNHVRAATEANVDGGVRRVRFYLVENDLVHEYTLPPWSVLAPLATQLIEFLRTR